MAASATPKIINSSALAVMLVVAGILLICGKNVSAAKCNADVPGLVAKCGEFVKKDGPKSKPSAECCGLVKNVNVPCVCSMITKEILQVISMEKVVYVAKCCGKEIAPGTKCGGYTVPSA